MHILITVNAMWNIQNFRAPLVRALLAEGHRVTVLAPPDDSAETLQGWGCRLVELEMDVKGLNPLRDFALMRRFARIFAREKPDVVLSFTIKNNIFGAMAAARHGIPFIPNVTGLGTAFLSGGMLQRLAEALYRRAFRRLRVVFFQNADDRDLFVGRRLVTEAQGRLLPGSGIDLARFAAAPMPEAGAASFLMISRPLRDKGLVEYAEAARIVKRRHPEAEFRVLGPLEAENRSAIGPEQIRAWEAEGLIRHLGATQDVRPHIAAADCVVLPSYREGAPRTLIEAAAMARPLITTDVPGCRTVVDHGVSGLLCKARDAESLARACLDFLALAPAERDAMGRAGRARMAAEFDEAIVVAAYREALGAVTATDPTREVT